MIIYKTTNELNKKMYVGQDTHNNQNYFGSGILIVRAIKKYGKENFKREIIDFAESIGELNEKERYWIKFYNCKFPDGYNLTDGGYGVIGYTFTEKDREKSSLAAKKSWGDPKIREKIIGGLIRALTKEAIENKSKAQKEAQNRPEVKQKASKSHKESWRKPEVREKRIKALSDLEVKKKISSSHKQSWSDPKIREKYIQAKRKKRGPNKKKSKTRSDKGKKRNSYIRRIGINL